MSREAPPDRRVQLGIESGTVFLRKKEIPDYTCKDAWLLKCEEAGFLYACACTRR